MTDVQDRSEPGAEVAVPEPDAIAVQAEPEAPELAGPGTTGVPAPQPRKVIYADVTEPGERRAIVPAPLQRANIRGTVTVLSGRQWHRTRYHGLRFPLYLIALVIWGVAGVLRLARWQISWWWVTEQAGLRNEAAAAGDSREWRSLHKTAQETRKVRGLVLLGEVAALALASLLLARFGPWWAWPVAALCAVLLLARTGRPEGVRIVSPAIVPPQYEVPTPEVITRALGSLGISAINQVIKEGRGISFVSPVMRDGPGWGVQLDLPHGVTAGHVILRRPELASGLRRPLSATWPEAVPGEHEGRLSLWVGFQDLAKTKPPRHPLLRAGSADVFAGIPYGTDPRQRPVMAPLFEVNWLIGAAPGQGKTNAVRNVAAAVAVDPLCDLWIHEQAGKGDLEPFAQVCHRYVSGLDDDSIAYAAESARMLRAELERRSRIFGRLPRAAKPEGKLTRELAQQMAGLRPLVAIFDECQNVFLHPAFGTEAAADLAHVIRLGRAYGIIVVLATQRPDKDSLPTAISGIVTCRFCLQVPDQVANDMILGTGAYKSGYNCVLFRPKTDAGLGWLKADGVPQIVRTYKLDLDPAARIAARGRALRERAGVLSGYALGEDVTEAGMPRDVLADVLAVFGDRAGLQWGELADRLAERFPDRWADATGESVSAQCRALDVASVDVKADGSVLKGCRRVGVERAAAGR